MHCSCTLCGQTLAGSGCCEQRPGPLLEPGCSKQRACISAFAASPESPTELSLYHRHPKHTKAFLPVCPPVQKGDLLNSCSGACFQPGSSDSELLIRRARRKSWVSLAHLQVVGLRAAANSTNFISNIIFPMITSQSGILLRLLSQRNMNFRSFLERPMVASYVVKV